MINDETTIRIKRRNKERLDEIGKKNDSYDDLIELLLNYYESKKKRRNNG